MKLTRNQKAVIALIIANIIWGAASPIFKWSLQDIGTFTLAFLRFIIAAYIVLPFTYKDLVIQKEHILKLFLATLFGITFNISFFLLALPYTASINAPIIASSGPIMLVIFASLFLHEKPKKKVIHGMFLSLIGVLIVIIRPTSNNLDLSIIGNLLLVAATISSVIHTVIIKKITSIYNYKTIVFWQFLIGSATFLPLMLNEIRTIGFLSNISMPGILGILFGALLSSATAYLLYHYALKYMSANETGIFTYIDPIAAIVIAMPLLQEQLTPAYILGSIFVFLGIYIAENRLNYHPIHKLSEGLKSVI